MSSPTSPPKPSARWIVSASFDRVWLIGPGVLPLVLLGAFPAMREAGAEMPLWAWVACILFVDVAHVWSTIYRTYLDPAELGRRPELYAGVPLACLGAGILLHSTSPLWFWRVLAYTAVFHFIRQQYGMVALYGSRGGWRSPLDARLDRIAIWVFTGYPILWWHTHQPRPFQWFVPDDFLTLPAWPLEPVGKGLWILTGVLIAARLIFVTIRDGPRAIGLGRPAILLTTALNWYLGIVAFEADFAFTVTNVLAHGIPYVALVWHYNHRKYARAAGTAPRWLVAAASGRAVPLFVASLVVLAGLEEALWDNLVWHDHEVIFGTLGGALPATALSFVVPLLALPQFTHYVLDGFIWRLDGSNPDLREFLFGRDDPRA